jgi:hypothetical protein
MKKSDGITPMSNGGMTRAAMAGVAAALLWVLIPASCASSEDSEPDPGRSTTRWVVEELHPDGSPLVEGEERLTADGKWVAEGRWVQRYESGAVEVEWERHGGEDDGPWSAWYANGRKHIEGALAEDKEHGEWLEWYPNGQPSSLGSYERGEAVGRWLHWKEDGSLDREMSGWYESNVRVRELEEDPVEGSPDSYEQERKALFQQVEAEYRRRKEAASRQ